MYWKDIYLLALIWIVNEKEIIFILINPTWPRNFKFRATLLLHWNWNWNWNCFSYKFQVWMRTNFHSITYHISCILNSSPFSSYMYIHLLFKIIINTQSLRRLNIHIRVIWLYGAWYKRKCGITFSNMTWHSNYI